MKIIVLTAIPHEYKIACQALKVANDKVYEKEKNHSLYTILTGPGKACAAQSTADVIAKLNPDLIIDSGACAGIASNLKIGDLILAFNAYEIDLGYNQIPSKIKNNMKIDSSLSNLPFKYIQMLKDKACNLAQRQGIRLIFGKQACGERCLNSKLEKEKIARVFKVDGFCWETAAVFLAARRSGKPALSLRAVTDLGDEKALIDFRYNLKRVMPSLYDFINLLQKNSWLEEVLNMWKRLSERLKKPVF